MVMVKVCILAAVCITSACSSIAVSEANKLDECKQVDVARNITLEQLTGKWNIKEVTYHLNGQKGKKVKIKEYDYCCTLEVQKERDTTLFVQWSYPETSIKYKFLTEGNEPVVWQSVGSQHVAGSDIPGFKNFAGNVQVMKVNHKPLLVLYFCANKEDHYSLTLSRDIEVSQDDLHTAHELMEKQGLPRSTVQNYCSELTLKNAISSNLMWPILAGIVVAIAVIIALCYFCL